MDIYKLDTRVTVLFSRAQADALQEVARKGQTSVSAIIRALAVVELQKHHPKVLQVATQKMKEKHSD